MTVFGADPAFVASRSSQLRSLAPLGFNHGLGDLPIYAARDGTGNFLGKMDMGALEKARIILGGGILYVAGMGIIFAGLGMMYPVELQLIFATFGILHGWLALRSCGETSQR